MGLFAAVVRIGVVLSQPITLHNDSADYQRLAVSLATGHGFGVSHFAPGGGPTALRPPLFPLVVSGIYDVFGVHLTAARLVEALLGAVFVVLLVVMTWLLLGRTVALVAGVIAAVFPPLVMASTSLMSESVALPLEMAAVLAVVLHRRTGHLRYALASGALLGLLVLTRPSLAILVVPLVALTLRWRPSGRQLAAAGLVVLAGTLVVMPWLIRDRVVMGSWVPVTTQSGYVLSGTYNATSANDPNLRAAWRPANFDPSMDAILTSHPHAGEVKTDALLESAAVHYIEHHPTYVATVAVQNTLRLFDLERLAQTRAATTSEYGYGSGWGTAEAVGGPLLLALALLGLCTRAGRRLPLALYSAPVLLWLSTVVLQAVPRFREVIDPFLVQLAAAALVAAAGALRRWTAPEIPVRVGTSSTGDEDRAQSATSPVST